MIESLGIIGWDDAEPAVLSALVARQPLLLVGSHGANKTDGARLLSYATLGREARFQSYDTRLIHQDDLMGFANPASLREGNKVTYAHTEISIWGAKSVLLDEFNRTNPFVASKVMEIVRTRKVHGRSLDLELVFASANPPGGMYDTVFLDPAVASRFSIIRIPDKLSADSLDKILALPDDWIDLVDVSTLSVFRDTIENARKIQFDHADLEKAYHVVRAIILSLRQDPSPPLYVSPRQGKMMVRMLLAYRALVALGVLKDSEKAKASIVFSLIPEITGMCRVSLDKSLVQSHVNRVLSGFRLGDPLVTSSSLTELLDRQIPDRPVWAATVKGMAQACTDPAEVHRFLQKLARKGLDNDTFSSLCSSGLTQYLTLAAEEGDARLIPISWNRTELQGYVTSLFSQEPTEVPLDIDDLTS